MVTVVERKTRQLISRAVENRTKIDVANAMIDAMRDIAQGVQSIMFDNGGEFADHQRIEKALGCKTYFARPYRSSDRGTNEHVNGQLRKYYPKGRSLRDVDPFYPQVNVEHLNSIPPEIINFASPQRRFDQEFGVLKTLPPN